MIQFVNLICPGMKLELIFPVVWYQADTILFGLIQVDIITIGFDLMCAMCVIFYIYEISMVMISLNFCVTPFSEKLMQRRSFVKSYRFFRVPLMWFHVIWWPLLYDIKSYDLIYFDLNEVNVIWCHFIWHDMLWNDKLCNTYIIWCDMSMTWRGNM